MTASRLHVSWPALLLAPLFALADQSVAYAFVEWSCETRVHGAGHATHAIFLILTLATAWMSAAEWRAMRRHAREDAGDPGTRRRVMAMAATMVALLSAWVILAMWLPQFILSPCHG